MTEPQAMLAIAEGDIKVLGNLLPTMPSHISSVPDAVATMLVARELGLMPMTAFPDLMVINGNVGMTSKLMLALVFKAGHRSPILEMSDTRASRQAFRREGDELIDMGEISFTWEQAEAANLAPKDTYQAYPADMLMNKCIARMVRFIYPDVIRGYVPDEMTDITGVEFEDAIHLDPDGPLLDIEEVMEVLDAEVVEVEEDE